MMRPSRDPVSALLLLPLLLLASAAEAEGQAVAGTVIDQRNREPLAGAQVEVADAQGELVGRTLTDESGRFVVPLASAQGPFAFEASAFGYEPRSIPSFRVPAGDTLRIEVPLEPRPFQFDTLRVERRRGFLGVTPGWIKLQERQARGHGIFLSGAIIHRADPPSLTHYLAQVEGLQLTSDSTEAHVTGLSSVHGRRCMRVRVNDWQTFEGGSPDRMGGLFEENMDDLLTTDIAAVEIYRSFEEVPDELQMDAHPCGLVNIWLWPAYCGAAGCPSGAGSPGAPPGDPGRPR